MVRNRTALVTGGSKGIGLAISRLLVDRGYLVTIASRTTGESTTTMDKVRDALGDLNSPDFRRELASLFSDSGLDILVNNVGVYVAGPLSGITDDVIAEVINTNLISHVSLVRELLPLIPLDTGVIGFVGSKAGIEGAPGEPVFCASKFGLRGFYESLRTIPAGERPRIVALEPSSVNTWNEPEPNDHLIPEEVAEMFDAAVHSTTKARFVRIELHGKN